MRSGRPTEASASASRSRGRRVLAALVSSGLVVLLVAPLTPVAAKHDDGQGQVVVSPAVQFDVSALPLGDTAPAASLDVKDKKEHKKNELPEAPAGGQTSDVQATPGAGAAPTASTSFDGIGIGLGTYSPRWAPPDTEGAVGPNHYFEIVNADIAVFSKTGTLLYGPAPTNTLWSGFGGGCQNRDDGDGIVEYDRLANRWVVTQFTNDGTNTECVAVSTSGDPLGTWARYSFTYPAFPDYPKLSVWSDAYYITFNLFGSSGFVGGMVCAYDRAKMLAGAPATQQCFQLSASYGGLLPSDLDGSTPPPAGSPNFVVNYGTNRLNLWKFHVDWGNAANTTLTGPTAIAVASFSPACGSCIPQPSTNQKLDSLSDRLMSRLAYRNFGDHESLVVNHSVGTGFLNTGPSAVRWYELRNPSGTPVVYQQGTYAPDSSTYRWMGSIAQDSQGNMALGYSASSGSVFPSIRYTGRVANDALNTMQAETTIVTGGGSQLPNLGRWGDYSSMTVDPADDCTFWYANEYLKANGTWNWSTRIASFKFAGCGAAKQNQTISFTSTAPAGATVGGPTYTPTATATSGLTVALTIDATASAVCSISGGVVSFTSAGTCVIDANQAGNGTYNPAPQVQQPFSVAQPDFTISVSPTSSSTVSRGGSVIYAVTVTPSNGFRGPVTLSLTGQPSGSTVTFSLNPATISSTSPVSSTLTVKTSRSGPRGTFTLRITGTNGSLAHTTTTSLTVTK